MLAGGLLQGLASNLDLNFPALTLPKCDIQVWIDIYEPCIESDAKNKVSDDTIETLSVSKVDAEGEVFGDANETHKLKGTTLPLLIHEPSKCEILLNDV